MSVLQLLVWPLSTAVFTLFVVGGCEACAEVGPRLWRWARARFSRGRGVRPIVFTLGGP